MGGGFASGVLARCVAFCNLCGEESREGRAWEVGYWDSWLPCYISGLCGMGRVGLEEQG